MKNFLIVMACIFAANGYAAEQDVQHNAVVRFVNNTRFWIVKDDVLSYTQQARVIFVGWNQQRTLKESHRGDRSDVGSLITKKNNRINVLPKQADSRSDDDSCKPFSGKDDGKWKQASKSEVSCKVVQIIEPRIMFENFNTRHGKTHGYFPEYSSNVESFYGEDAFVHANQDLALCYKTILHAGIEMVRGQDRKMIVIDLLGGSVGLRRSEIIPITYNAIVSFLQNNNSAYADVILFVKKRSELDAFEKLFQAYTVRAMIS
jgi:hypothetical protein